MKVSKLFMGMLTALALSACSDDVNVPDVPDVNGDDSRFMAVEITTTPSGAGSRGVNTEADNIDADNYEKGTKNENEVKTLRFYFFQANGAPAKVTALGTNYVTPEQITSQDDTPENAPTGWPNVEKKLKAILVLSTKANDTTTGLSSMVAVANYDRTALKDVKESLSLSDLQGYIGNYDEDGNKPFVMTSSVFGAANYNCAAQVTAQNLKTSQAEAIANPVNIYIERVVAKVRVAADWDENIETKELTYDGNTYNAVPLKNSKGDSYTFGSDNKPIYAIFTGWHVTGTAKQSYLFKNVDNWAGWDPAFNGWHWNNPSWFRSYWAINPSLTDDIKSERNWKATDDGLDKYYLKYYPLSVINANNVIGGTIKGVAQTAMYCQENAGTWSSPNNGKKLNYSPDATLSNRTQAIFAAILVEDKNGEAKPVEIAEWGGQRYATDDLKTAMLNSVGSLIYERFDIKTEEVTQEDGTKGPKTTWKTRSIQPDDVKFVTGGSYVVQNGKRYAAYLQLTDAAKDKTFYKDSDGNVAYGEGEVDAIFNGMPKAKIWKNGLTYYYYDIEHLNQTSDETGAETGKYGVVRNHIYDIKLTKIFGLGTPIYTPDEGEGEEIIPEKPKDDDTFVAAKIHILSWRVVHNNAELDWD